MEFDDFKHVLWGKIVDWQHAVIEDDVVNTANEVERVVAEYVQTLLNEQAAKHQEELLTWVRKEAAERLRADMGWGRYDSSNALVRELEMKLAKGH